MNRAERRALGVPKTVASNIEEAEKRRTVNTYSVAVASVLWDMNKDKEEVHSILGKILDRFDTIKKDYATMEDYRIMLREEAGIEIKYCESILGAHHSHRRTPERERNCGIRAGP